MFILYTPESKHILQCVIPLDNGPWFEWSREIHDTSIIPTLEDAVKLAREIQQVRANEDIFHYSVQVIPLSEKKIPAFERPAFEITAPQRVSMN